MMYLVKELETGKVYSARVLNKYASSLKTLGFTVLPISNWGKTYYFKVSELFEILAKNEHRQNDIVFDVEITSEEVAEDVSCLFGATVKYKYIGGDE